MAKRVKAAAKGSKHARTGAKQRSPGSAPGVRARRSSRGSIDPAMAAAMSQVSVCVAFATPSIVLPGGRLLCRDAQGGRVPAVWGSRVRRRPSRAASLRPQVMKANPAALRRAMRQVKKGDDASCAAARVSCGCNVAGCGGTKVGPVHLRVDLFQLPGTSQANVAAATRVVGCNQLAGCTLQRLCSDAHFKTANRGVKFMIGLEMARAMAGAQAFAASTLAVKRHKQHAVLSCFATGAFKLDAATVRELHRSQSSAAVKAYALSLVRPRNDICAAALDRVTAHRGRYEVTGLELSAPGVEAAWGTGAVVTAARAVDVIAGPATPRGQTPSSVDPTTSTQRGWRVTGAGEGKPPPPAYDQDGSQPIVAVDGDAVAPEEADLALFADVTVADYEHGHGDGVDAANPQDDDDGEDAQGSGSESDDGVAGEEVPLSAALRELSGKAAEALKQHLDVDADGELPLYASQIIAGFVAKVKRRSAADTWGMDWFRQQVAAARHPREFVQSLSLFDSLAEFEAFYTWMNR